MKYIEFPAWIANEAKKNRDQLSANSFAFFEKALEIYPSFLSMYINIPKISELGVLTNSSPWSLEEEFDKRTLPYFISANSAEVFHYNFIYQIREIGLAMHQALEAGSFYVASVLNRSMLELVCSSYDTLRRVEAEFKESMFRLKEASKTKSVSERGRTFTKHYEGVFKIHALLHEANTTSSINWAEHMKEFGYDLKLIEHKKIHVHNAIKDIGRLSDLPTWKIYGLMSEFAHPNLGGKMLVVNTRRPKTRFMDVVVLGENSGNSEAALFYIDQLSESLFCTITLACSLSDRSQNFLNHIFGIIDGIEKQQLH